MIVPHNVKPCHMVGGAWRARKNEKGQRASRTPGNKKGLVPPTIVRFICRSNKSYKHPDYSWWCEKADGNKIQWSSKK